MRSVMEMMLGFRPSFLPTGGNVFEDLVPQ